MKTMATVVCTVITLIVSTFAYEAQAAPCDSPNPSIKGKFSSYSLGNSTLGIVKATCANGKNLEGALSGQILQQPTQYQFVWKHIMAIPGHGLIFTGPDTSTVTGADPTNPSILYAVETITIIGGTGEFQGCTGTATAKGTINAQTFQNDFKFEANLSCQ